LAWGGWGGLLLCLFDLRLTTNSSSQWSQRYSSPRMSSGTMWVAKQSGQMASTYMAGGSRRGRRAPGGRFILTDEEGARKAIWGRGTAGRVCRFWGRGLRDGSELKLFRRGEVEGKW